MAVTQRWLKPFRTLHLYFGVFTAPALLFFAITGALQSMNLQEATRGSDYKPPAWIASLAHMHRKQSLDVPVKRAPPKTPAVAAADPSRSQTVASASGKPSFAPPSRNLWPMKIFFVLVSLSLLLSSLTGIYMGWRCTRNRHRYSTTLAAGIVAPALLLLF